MRLHGTLPAAATPKDGPSAGMTIKVALISRLQVHSGIDMAGELSL